MLCQSSVGRAVTPKTVEQLQSKLKCECSRAGTTRLSLCKRMLEPLLLIMQKRAMVDGLKCSKLQRTLPSSCMEHSFVTICGIHGHAAPCLPFRVQCKPGTVPLPCLPRLFHCTHLVCSMCIGLLPSGCSWEISPASESYSLSFLHGCQHILGT